MVRSAGWDYNGGSSEHYLTCRKDVCGSCFAVQAYEVHPDFGGNSAVECLRARIHSRGLRLLLDSFPTTPRPEHEWVQRVANAISGTFAATNCDGQAVYVRQVLSSAGDQFRRGSSGLRRFGRLRCGVELSLSTQPFVIKRPARRGLRGRPLQHIADCARFGKIIRNRSPVHLSSAGFHDELLQHALRNKSGSFKQFEGL